MSAASDQVTMTLPDGKAMTFTRGVTGGEIAAAIGPGLAKAALIIMVNGQEYDLFRLFRPGARPLRPLGRRLDDAGAPAALPSLGYVGARFRARIVARKVALVYAVALRTMARDESQSGAAIDPLTCARSQE